GYVASTVGRTTSAACADVVAKPHELVAATRNAQVRRRDVPPLPPRASPVHDDAVATTILASVERLIGLSYRVLELTATLEFRNAKGHGHGQRRAASFDG